MSSQYKTSDDKKVHMFMQKLADKHKQICGDNEYLTYFDLKSFLDYQLREGKLGFKIPTNIVKGIKKFCKNRLEEIYHPIISTIKEFKINDYLTLKLENFRINIYVGDKMFQQCKYLAFNINLDQIQNYEEIQSIDDLELIDRTKEYLTLDISPEEEFWGHCSV